MSATQARISALLREAADLHHRVWRTTDGVDPDWPSWYADWLTNHSELPALVQRRLVRSELTWVLVNLANEDEAGGGAGPWEERYAAGILRHFGEAAPEG